MIKVNTSQFGALALLLVLSQAATAASQDVAPWVLQAFAEGSADAVEVIDDATMQEIRGKYLQVAYIIGVATFDLALIELFWGTYLPYIYRSNRLGCATCYFPTVPY